MVGNDEDAHAGGQPLDEAAHRAVQPLVDFGNEVTKLRRRPRVVARVRGVHVGPVVMLRAVQHRKDDHQEIPLAPPHQEFEGALAGLDGAAEFGGARLLVRQARRLDEVIRHGAQQLLLERRGVSEIRLQSGRQHSRDHQPIQRLGRISRRHVDDQRAAPLFAEQVPDVPRHDVAPAHGAHAVAAGILDEGREDAVHAFAGACGATGPAGKAVRQDGRAQRRAGALAHQAREHGQAARRHERADDVKRRAIQSYDYGFHLEIRNTKFKA